MSFLKIHVITFRIGKCVMPTKVVRGLKEFLWSHVSSLLRTGKLVLRMVPVKRVLEERHLCFGGWSKETELLDYYTVCRFTYFGLKHMGCFP